MHMKYVIVGLGNPDAEYAGTRHNVGRDIVRTFGEAHDAPDFALNKKAESLVAKVTLGEHTVQCVLPETYMNKSGKAVQAFVGSVAVAKRLIVVHDDLDLPIGTLKIVFDRGAGGHKGVESVQRALKTNAFIRIRVGIAKPTAKGVAKKLHDEEKVVKLVLGKPKDDEAKELKKIMKHATDALGAIIVEGLPFAMNHYIKK